MNQDENGLMELSKPLIAYLKENCHPYTSIVITEERVAVIETTLSIPDRSLEPINFVPEDSNGKYMKNCKSEPCDVPNQRCFP